MKVPKIITLQLISAPGLDLSGVIVQLTLSTGQRNPRRVSFPKTDSTGRSALDRRDLLGQFSDATQADLMGSWGSIHDVRAEVEVSLYDPAPALSAPDVSLSWPLLPHEKTKWTSRAAEYAHRTSCRNLFFHAPAVVVDLHATTHIDFPVQPAHAGAR